MTKKKTNKTAKQKHLNDATQSGIEVILKALLQMVGKLVKRPVTALLFIVLAVVGIGYFALQKMTDTNASIEIDQRIGVTPTQIESMKAIGEWEFLSIADEELTDTVRNGFFKDDELIRIYYGTLRLGIDMSEVKDGWITKDHDTIDVLLPPVKLLDEKFIDEARTKSFFESGKWSDQDRENLYQRAYQRMKQRCLTKENIASAEQNASKQFYQLMRSMGFENVRVRMEQPVDTEKQSR